VNGSRIRSPLINLAPKLRTPAHSTTRRAPSILAFALKIRRRSHESDTLIHHPLADIEVLCHRTPNILILDAVRLDPGEQISTATGYEGGVLQARRPGYSGENGGDEDCVDGEME
jgi:hypothetical protein